MRHLIIPLLLVLAACASADAPAASSPVPATNTVEQTEATPEPPVVEATQVEATDNTALDPSLVARVNGEPITRDEFQAALERRRAGTQATDETALANQVLDTLIEQRLIRQAAANAGISVTDAEVQAEIDALRSSVGTDDGWQSFLDMNNYTEATLFNAQRDSILTQRMLAQIMAPLMGDVEQVRARHILVSSEAEANAVLERLRNGEDFQTLAAEVSIDQTTRDQGGDLGWFTVDELLDRRLAEVAFEIDQGAIAGPVVTRIGYHIIQTVDRAARPIESERMALLVESLYNRWLQEQIAAATIERNL